MADGTINPKRKLTYDWHLVTESSKKQVAGRTACKPACSRANAENFERC